MLLPRMRIRAGGRKLDLSSYFPHLIQAEKDGAFPSIPLQVAEGHSKSPKHTEGAVSNLVHLPDGPDGDGLYGDVEFADQDGVKMVAKSMGRVGVSVSMVENLVREEDGRTFRWPAALQHVLMTTDPHVRQTGGGWHPIELSNEEVDQVIDLSGSTYEEIEEQNMTAPTETAPAEGTPAETVTLEVTPEQRDQLLAFLDDHAAATQIVAEGRGSLDDTTTPPAVGPTPDAPPAGGVTSLERDDADAEPGAIELMREEIATERQHRIDLQRELSAARAANEIDRLEQTGLAPSIINLARPVLELEPGSGAIELSRDFRGRAQTVDPTRVLRDVLREVIELGRQGLGVVDLDREVGMHIGSEPEQAERAAKLKAWDEQFPID